MNIPDEFGLLPFQRLTTGELWHFFIWCTTCKISDVDLTGGSPVSVSRFGRRVHCSSVTLPITLMLSLIDELLGREVIPHALAGNPVNRTIQINGDVSDRYDLKRGERIRLCSHLIQGTPGAEEKAASITMRIIPTEMPDILSMNIEPDLLETMVRKSGLGFVCGETGSGKSALCSALYRHVMDNFPDAEIVTYEDPVGYILRGENDLLPSHQVKIGRGVASFAAGLRSAVRHNLGVINASETRDSEIADVAIQTDNTGYCCLSAMHTRSPGETLARLPGLFPPVIRDSMAWAVLSLLQFILVQVLVRTNDGDHKAVREYIAINDELRDNLSGMPHAEWGHHIDAIIRQEKHRIRGQILEMCIRDEVGRREAILFISSGELWS